MYAVNQMPRYDVGPTNLKIYDSYLVRKCDMRSVLERIKAENTKETTVFNRSFFSLKTEWICHNFLYNIGYERTRTKDVDLDNPSDRPEWLYCACGLLVWLFVW